MSVRAVKKANSLAVDRCLRCGTLGADEDWSTPEKSRKRRCRGLRNPVASYLAASLQICRVQVKSLRVRFASSKIKTMGAKRCYRRRERKCPAGWEQNKTQSNRHSDRRSRTTVGRSVDAPAHTRKSCIPQTRHRHWRFQRHVANHTQSTCLPTYQKVGRPERNQREARKSKHLPVNDNNNSGGD